MQPEDRMAVLSNWFLSLFNHIQNESLRKPFNSIAGEVFKCSWKADPSMTYSSVENPNVTFIGEQVSHHPTG